MTLRSQRLTTTLGALLVAALSLPAQASQVLDYIVAVVDEDVILASELEQATDSIRSQILSTGASNMPPEDVLRDQVRERLILQTLQNQRAQRRGIQITDDELNLAMAQLAEQNKLSLREFARALRDQGLDYLYVRDQVRNEMTVGRLRGLEVESRVVVSERDLEEFLSRNADTDNSVEYRVQQILVAVPDGASTDLKAEAKADAEQILSALQDGADFAKMAISRSDGQRALEGGDLGWRPLAALPTLFADQIVQLQPGGISKLLESGSGYHIIRLAEQRGGTQSNIVSETLARHILIQADKLRDDSQAEQLLIKLRGELEDGADFAELAREHSDDPGSANQGGVLGWRPAGSFVPKFEAQLSNLEVGTLSPVFKSRFGWHIIEVMDRRERDNAQDVMRAEAREAIRARKVAEEYESWLRRMRSEAYLELRAAPTSIDREPTPEA